MPDSVTCFVPDNVTVMCCEAKCFVSDVGVHCNLHFLVSDVGLYCNLHCLVSDVGLHCTGTVLFRCQATL